MTDKDSVKIVVQDDFRDTVPDIMDVLPSEAIKVVRNPDAQEVIEMGEGSDLRVHLSVRFPSDKKPYYLLVLDRFGETGERILHDAFKFFDDLCPDVSKKTPIQLLTAVADRFAYLVQPGGTAKMLILQESFACDSSDVSTETIIRMMMPTNMNEGEQVSGTQYIKHDARNQMLEFAVAFVWNATRYKEYLAGGR
jgi:hypothetical protein